MQLKCWEISVHWKLQVTDKEIQEDTKNGGIPHVCGSEKLTLLRCPYYPKLSTDSMQPDQNSSGTFHRSRKYHPKICIES